jgi:molecular chaperone HtpG
VAPRPELSTVTQPNPQPVRSTRLQHNCPILVLLVRSGSICLATAARLLVSIRGLDVDVQVNSFAERQAQRAETLEAFGGLNILHIKRQVADLLREIGGGGIFDEYTRHDLQHVDAMLKMLEWLVPNSTKERMTPADWLMLVLAIYFHDMGMLVTKEEYKNRNRSGFPGFRDNVLFSNDDEGRDYADKVSRLSAEDANRFLYQEFVRANHAARIRAWIDGVGTSQLGVSDRVVSEIEKLLAPLGETFRTDLGIVCESHHSDNLDDLSIYRLSRPYGNTDDETANLQYAAILLRTVDLLHITRDRTPSIVFRVINPTDPLSQQEWAKQMAVRAVRSQAGRDREGNVILEAPRNTIEVHANFSSEDGFFGLTSYLSYAANQLDMSYRWAQESLKHGSVFGFPWRYIDQSFIETRGFLSDQFEFTLDQARILDLLTGHTLYNDTSVVLRELVQNSIDAIRFQRSVLGAKAKDSYSGEVRIRWDSRTRVLEVWDDGTGMTQTIIERHLLKVGASRYQDPKFKELHPDFSPISRFGIGVLSTFMIADSVEIITCHPEEPQVRQLSLRSVHGKYLIRLLDKEADAVARSLAPHGTLVRLRVRPSAILDEVLDVARRWFVIPDCAITLTVDDGPPEVIGFSSVGQALKNILVRDGFIDDEGKSLRGDEQIEVREKAYDGLEVAYAVRWSKFFNEWHFLPGLEVRGPESRGYLGTCVEGIRVEFGSPGFTGNKIYSIANGTGPRAPRTNVARSGLEATPEYEALVAKVYEAYCAHVRQEVTELHKQRGYSLTWAATEVSYLIGALLRQDEDRNIRPVSRRALNSAVARLPAFVLEEDGHRVLGSIVELADRLFFWTVENALLRHSEYLIRQIPGDVSLRSLIGNLTDISLALPEGPLLCTLPSDTTLLKMFQNNWEIEELRADLAKRRLDVKWARKGERTRWVDSSQLEASDPRWLRDFERQAGPSRRAVEYDLFFGTYEATSRVLLPIEPISALGFQGEEAVRIGDAVVLLPGGPWKRLLQRWEGLRAEAPNDFVVAARLSAIILYWLFSITVRVGWDEEDVRLYLERDVFPALRIGEAAKYVSADDIEAVLTDMTFSILDIRAWERPVA